MAAAATLPAMPAPARLPRSTRGPSTVPFDATTLCAKLEAHQRKHESVELQPVDQSAQRAKRASYVPQHAAKHFAATTTPMKHSDSSDVKRAKSTRVPKQSRPTVPRSMSDHTADGKPCMNPKQLQALLSNGMSESQAAAMNNDVPTRQSSNSSASTASTWNDQTVRRQKRQSNLLASKDTAPVVKRTSQQEPATSSNRASQKEPAPSSKRTSQGYKPGDAAKRNSQKRASMAVKPQGKLIAIKHGSQTTYEREFTLDFGERMAKAGQQHDSAIDVEDDADRPLHTFRPKLQSHDRVNWAQQSQCGDSMHDLLHPRWAGRRKSKTTSDREDALAALTGSNSPEVKRPVLGRQRSLNDLPAEHLVSDAVKKIKQEEKKKRRQSIVSFFKRL